MILIHIDTLIILINEIRELTGKEIKKSTDSYILIIFSLILIDLTIRQELLN